MTGIAQGSVEAMGVGGVSAHDPAPARIGPNAILQLMAAFEAAMGRDEMHGLMRQAGLAHYLEQAPGAMVDEDEVIRLHQLLRQRVGPDPCAEISRDAGHRTAAYLLANRIPPLAQKLLRALPARLSTYPLLMAIGRNAWTFTGSGHYAATGGRPTVVTIDGCPLTRGLTADRPVCDYYAGTFEGLFRALVHPAVTVRETACRAAGAETCRFEAAWPTTTAATTG